MPDKSKTILISVAHSRPNGGSRAPNDELKEYEVSLRASLAAFRQLAGLVPVELFDVGNVIKDEDYARIKINTINRCKPALALEIHCNSSADFPSANYCEVIHHRKSTPGQKAAKCVADALSTGFLSEGQGHWKFKGARPNTIEHDDKLFFFLERTNVPAIIIEGLFISNLEQARWLQSGKSQEFYGMYVADGITNWAKMVGII